MKKFNKFLRAIGGKYFIDEDGFKHKADQWEHLVVRIASYRKRAGKPPGNPEQEILDQVCARQPEYCQEDKLPVPAQRAIAAANESTRASSRAITQWLASILRSRRIGGAQQVPREEARRRAAICAGCPMQKSFSSSCGSCKAMRKTAKQILFGGNTSVGEKLKGCRVLGEDTSTSVHISQDPSSNPALPANCWRKS
jgi:hypothetical protein